MHWRVLEFWQNCKTCYNIVVLQSFAFAPIKEPEVSFYDKFISRIEPTALKCPQMAKIGRYHILLLALLACLAACKEDQRPFEEETSIDGRHCFKRDKNFSFQEKQVLLKRRFPHLADA